MIVYIRENLVSNLILIGVSKSLAKKLKHLEGTKHSLIGTFTRDGVQYVTIKSGEEIPRSCCDIILGEKILE